MEKHPAIEKRGGYSNEAGNGNNQKRRRRRAQERPGKGNCIIHGQNSGHSTDACFTIVKDEKTIKVARKAAAACR